MFKIYIKKSNDTLELTATANTYEESLEKYADIIRYTRIQDVLMLEDLEYSVIYDSLTQKYTAQYPEEDGE